MVLEGFWEANLSSSKLTLRETPGTSIWQLLLRDRRRVRDHSRHPRPVGGSAQRDRAGSSDAASGRDRCARRRWEDPRRGLAAERDHAGRAACASRAWDSRRCSSWRGCRADRRRAAARRRTCARVSMVSTAWCARLWGVIRSPAIRPLRDAWHLHPAAVSTEHPS